MTIQRFKVALNSARFPLISTKGSRAVFIPGLDSAPRTPRAFTGTELSADYNTAQILYGENIMPQAEGYCSVGYTQAIAPSTNTDFTNMFPLRDQDENTALYSPSAGKNYVYDDVSAQWTTETVEAIYGLTLSSSSTYTPATAKVSYAYVAGFTFVCYAGLRSTANVDMSLLLWDPATKSLSPASSLITNVPFNAGTIDGIAASSGFLLIWSGIEVAWAQYSTASSSFDFERYANGETTGSGIQTPEDVKGRIQAIIGVSGGFIAFTTKNAIAANYHANNLQSPWLFRELTGAGGISSYEQATVEGSLGLVYAYTTAGLQRLSLNSAEAVQPQVADFITGRAIERYDTTTRTLTQTVTGQDLAVKVTNIGNRYIAISYGATVNQYEYVILYDLALERWGKLKFAHTDCFYFSYTPGSTALTYSLATGSTYSSFSVTEYAELINTPTTLLIPAAHAVGFMTTNGGIHIATWDSTIRTPVDAGLAIIGRVQLARARNSQLMRVEIEGFNSGTVNIGVSYDGRTIAATPGLTTVTLADDLYIGGTLVECKNFDVIVAGSFNISTVIIEALTSGQF